MAAAGAAAAAALLVRGQSQAGGGQRADGRTADGDGQPLAGWPADGGASGVVAAGAAAAAPLVCGRSQAGGGLEAVTRAPQPTAAADGGPRVHACKRCNLVLDLGHFRSPERSFWTCRPCEYKASVAYRRADPGCRLARRLRMQGHKITAVEVRAILEFTNAMDKAIRDEVTIVQQRQHEPLTPNNARVVPRAARAAKTIFI